MLYLLYSDPYFIGVYFNVPQGPGPQCDNAACDSVTEWIDGTPFTFQSSWTTKLGTRRHDETGILQPCGRVEMSYYLNLAGVFDWPCSNEAKAICEFIC